MSSSENEVSQHGRNNTTSRRASASGSDRSRDERLDSPLPSDTGIANDDDERDLFGSGGSDEEVDVDEYGHSLEEPLNRNRYIAKRNRLVGLDEH